MGVCACGIRFLFERGMGLDLQDGMERIMGV